MRRRLGLKPQNLSLVLIFLIMRQRGCYTGARDRSLGRAERARIFE